MPLTRTPGRPGSRRRLPPAAALIPLAAILAGCAAAAAPHAHADGHLLAVEISNATASPTDLEAVPFTMNFSRAINSSTLDASDIRASSGKVQNLRAVLSHRGDFGGPGSGNGSLSDPTAVAVDAASGNVYVADGTSNRVHVFDPGGNFTGALPGGFNWPTGVAVNSSGSVHVVDYPPGRIAVFDSAHRSTANITRSGMDSPYAVAVDGSGNIYVLENTAEVLQIFNSSGVHVGFIARQFWDPRGVAVNASGYIYVANKEHDRVDIFNPAHGYAGALPGEFSKPEGVAVDIYTGTIYVADTGSNRVGMYDPAPAYIGDLPGSFSGPTGVAAGPSGEIYVADRGNRTIQAFRTVAYEFDVANPADRQTLTVEMQAGRVQDPAGNANGASNTASIYVSRTALVPAVSSAQQSPTNASTIGFAVEFTENVTGFNASRVMLSGTAGHAGVANFSGGGGSYSFTVSPTSDGTIRVDIPEGAALDAHGIPSAAAGRFLVEYDGTPPAPAVAPAQPGPTNLAAVPFNLTFSEPVNTTALEASDISASSGNVTNLRSVWPHGADIGSHGSGPDQLNTPHGVAVNASGHAYVADTLNHRVSVFDKTGHNVGHIGGPSTFTHPHDVAVGGPHGRVYVADTDNDRVRVFDSEWEHVHDINYTTPGNQFGIPSGVAVDSSGSVYVADRGTHRVYVFDRAWQYVRDVGDSYDQPNGIAVDSSGNAYVADSNEKRVRVYDAEGLPVVNITNSFDYPFAVDVDPAGNVFVADANNHRVQVFDSAWQPVTNLTRSFNVVTGVGVDPATGDVYASGRNNHRVTLFDAAHAEFDVAGPDDLRILTAWLPAGRVQDPAGNANGESNAASIRIDRTAPVPAINSTQPNPTGAPTIRFTVEFTEGVDGFGPGGVVLSGTADHAGVANFSGAGASYSFTVSPTANGTILVDIPEGAAEDDAGNGNEPAGRFSIEYDNSLLTPTVTAAQRSPTNAATINFTVDFSRPVTGFGAGGVMLSGTADHAGVEDFTGAGASYSFGVSPTSDGTILVDIPEGAAQDAGVDSIAAGRFSITYDSSLLIPTVEAAQRSPTNAATIGFTVDFNRPAAGFEAGDVMLSGTAGHTGVANFTGAGASYSFGVSPTSDGTILVDIPAGAARDAAANSTAAERFSIEYDGTGPIPTVTAAQSRVTRAPLIGFTVEFTENVTGFNASRVMLSGTANHTGVENFAGAGASYSFEVSPISDGTVRVDIPEGAARDEAGNGNAAAERFSIKYDGTRPAADVTAARDGPTNATTVGFRLAFSEGVNLGTLGAPDIEASSGDVRNLHSRLLPDGNIGGLSRPGGVAVNASGYLYVADRGGGGRVAIFDPDRRFVGTLTPPGQFSNPSGVTIDGSGSVYVADTYNNRIRIYDSALQHDRDVGHGFNRPHDVAVDGASGNIYVADTFADRVQVFDSNWTHITNMWGFHDPHAVAFDGSGNIYVADMKNNRVQVFNSTRHYNDTISTAKWPRGVAVDPLGTVYVVSTSRTQVQIFDTARKHVATTDNDFRDPYNLAVDGPSGAVYVADWNNNRIRAFNTTFAFEVADPLDGQNLTVSLPAGRVQDRAGNANLESGAAGIRIDRTAPAPNVTSAQRSPTGAAAIGFAVEFTENVTGFNASRVILSGTANHTGVEDFAGAGASYSFEVHPASDGTVRVDIPEGAARDGAGNGNAAAEWFYVRYDGTAPVPAFAAALDGPTNLTAVPFNLTFGEPVDATTLEASDINASSGNVTNLRSVWPHGADFGANGPGDGQLDQPHGVAVDAGGRVYVADRSNHRVSVFDRAGNHLGHVGGPFLRPEDVAAGGPHGRVYVADTGNHTVRVYDAAWRHVHDIRNSFVNPSGVAVDSSGNAYVAVRLNHSVQVFDDEGRHVRDVGGPYDQPNGIAVDSSGRVYVADSNNNTVRVYDAEGRPVVNITNSFAYPFAVDVDPAGNVFVADAFNSRVAVFDSAWQHVADLTHPYDPLLTVTGVAVDPATGAAYASGRDNHRVSLFDAAYAFDVANPDDLRTLEVRMPAGRVQDAAGNPNAASDAAGIRIDRTGPAPNVTSAQRSPTGAATIPFAVEFTENVTGFGAGGVILSGTANHAGAENFAGAGASYSFHASPTSDGTILVDVPAGAARDEAGNNSTAAERFLMEYDGTPPVPTVASAQRSPTGAATIPFAVEFTENVTGFGAGGVILSGTADHVGVEDFAGAGASYSFAVSPISDGTVLVDIPAGAARDEAGNNSTAAGRFYVRYDGTAPVPAFAAALDGPTNLTAVPFNLTFGEPVNATTLEASDINASSGNVTNLRSVWPHGADFGASGPGDGQLDEPHGVAVDAGGRVYVADAGNGRVSVFDKAGNHLGHIGHIGGAGDLSSPLDVAAGGPYGRVYVADAGNGSVRVYDAAWRHVHDIRNSFNAPSGVAVDSSGNAYVAVRLNHSVQMFDREWRHVRDVGGQYDQPNGVAVDSSGTVYVADSGNNRTRVYDAAGLHVGDIENSFDYPFAVDVGPAGNVYVADTGNGRVQAFDPGWRPAANLTHPDDPLLTVTGVAVDPATGAAYASGRDNHRVSLFDAPRAEFDVMNPADGQELAVGLPAGIVRDAAGNANEESNTASIRIDRTAPAPNVTSAHPDPTGAPAIRFTVEFGESVTGFGAGDVALSGNATHGGVENFTGSGGSYSFWVSPTASGTILVDVPAGAAEDDAGNGNAPAERFSIGYDSSLLTPTVTAEQDSPTNAATISFRVDFTRPVGGFDAGDVILSGTAKHGGVEDFTNSSAAAYGFGVSPASDGTILVDIPEGAARDAADASISSTAAGRFSIEYDGTAPAPTVTAAQRSPTNESPIAFTVNFTEPVRGFGAGGVAISGAASGIDAGSFVRANSTTYRFAVSPAEDGTIRVDIPAGAARDDAGNGNEAAEPFSIRYDGTPPIPVIGSARTSPTNHAPINFTVNFGEGVDGFAAADVELAGAAPVPGSFAPVNSTAYAFHAAPSANGTILVDIPEGAARDEAGNYNTAAERFSMRYDGKAPAPVINSTHPDPTNSSPINFTVNFGEGVDGFEAAAVELAGAAPVQGSFAPIDATTYAFHAAPSANGTILVDVPAGAARDEAGNNSTAAERFSIEYDAKPPVPTITPDAGPGPARESPINFTVNFTEPVEFTSTDVKISGAASGIDAGSFDPVNPATYAFRVSPPAVGTILVDVPAGAALDDAGNGNTAAEQFSILYTGALPVPTIASGAGPGPATESPIAFTVTFSEDVTGFNATGIAISGSANPGNATNFDNASARTYTFDVAPSTVGTVLVDVPEGAAADSDGNGNEAAEQFSIRYTGALPVPTIASGAGPGPATESPIAFTVTFSKNVTGFDATGIKISGAASGIDDGSFDAVNATTYTFTVSPTTDGTVTVDVPAGAAEDSEDGTASAAAARFSIQYAAAAPPAAAPVPTIASGAGPGPATESPIAFTVTFSKNVTGFDATGIKISGAASGIDDGSFVPVSATTYTFSVSPAADGTVTVDVTAGAATGVADGTASAAAAQFSITYAAAAPPAAAPVPTIASGAGPGPATESPIAFTVTFSKNVTGFDATGIKISGAASGIDDGSFVPVSATTYTFSVSPAADGTVTVDVTAGAATGVADGTASAAAAQFSITYAAAAPPAAAPVPTIASGAGPGPATESPIAFTVTFDKPVTGFDATGIKISGAATGIDDGSFVPVTATTYTFTVSPPADGTVTVDVPAGAATGVADGTASAAAAQFSITYAAAAPPAAAPVPTIASGAGPGPATESPIAFTVTFDKPVTGFSATGIEISGAASGIDDGSFVPVSATTYTFSVSPAADGTVTVDVTAGAATGVADGTASAAAAQFSITYAAAAPPAAAPVPTIASDAGPGPATESPIAFTVTFDKPVTGFSATGIEISGAASGIDDGSFVAVSATTYTFTVSPPADGTVTVDVPAGAAEDSEDGTASAAAAQFSIQYAGGAPPSTQLVVESAAITGPQSITIRYDADADATGSAYHSIVVGGTPRSAALAGAGTDTHVLQFGGDAAARDATGNMAVNQTAVTDPGGRPLGSDAAYRQALADGQAPVLASAVLDLTAGENGLLTVTFDEAVAAAPDAPLSGEIVIRGDGGEVALSGSDIPSVASGRAGGATFALDVSGAKRIELNAADLGPAAMELPAAFVSDAPGNAYAPGRQPVPLAYVPDPSPPRLVKAAFNLAPAGGNAGRLVITFDEAATAPGAQSFPGTVEIRGRSWGGDAAVSLSAADILSVESGRTGDRTFVLLVSGAARAALDAAAFSDLESTTLLLPAGFVTNGRAAHAPERAPLDVARDPGGPSFLLAFVLDGSSVAAVYSEPVLAVPSHYTNITVDGAAAAGNGGGASEAAAYGNNVVVSWNADAGAAAAAGSAVGFDLSANVTDAFGNPVENPGSKSTGGPDGTGQAGKQPVQVGVFARGPADPSAEAARLGAAAFNAVSAERGYQFYVNVSEHDLPAGASGAAALRGAHAAGEGPSLYVGPASDIALAGMAGYASENGITIISHSSAARPLAVGGDPIFRMEPGAAHLARALATEVARGGFSAIVPVVQAGLRGPDYGLLESLESDLGPLGIPFGEPVEFAAGGGGAAAAPISDAVAAAAGSGTARSVAVVYVGSDMELAAMAGSVPAGGPVRERSAWFAAGGAGAGAGSGVAASPAITDDAAAMQLARDTRLSAVQFAVERNSMTDYIDRIAAPRGPAASATPAYAAYEAVRALGGALVGAGGDPSLARGNVAGAANLEGGPLGRTGMDGNGDLRLPVTYGIWSVSDVSAEWARAPELLRGLDACGIDLEKSALALPELSAGSTSRPARQTVTNIGTGPMPAVSVSATDWAQFLNGVPLPGPLPFSYTEMAVGLDGASPRPADSTPLAAGTEIPGGTPPGGSVDVDFRINLGGLDALEADIISQTVTFVANCS